MAKTSTIITWAAAGFAFLWWAGTQVVAGLNLVFYPGSVTAISMSGATPVITFTMQVQNTSGTALNFNSLSGNITSGSTLIGNIYNFTPIIIAPNSTSLIPVTAQLNAIGLANDIVTAFSSNASSQAIIVEGVANVNNIQIPVNLNFTVGT